MFSSQDLKNTLNWYNTHAQEYAQKIASMHDAKLIEKFVHAVGENGRVLDAGCAAGRDSRLLRDSGLEVTGLDLSTGLLAIARKNNPDITFVEGNFLDLPFEAHSFDGVWAHASLLHLESAEQVRQALSEFRRVLRPDGVLHVMVKQQMGQEKTSVVSDSLSGHDRFFQWFAKDEVRLLLEREGFVISTLKDGLPDSAQRPKVQWIYALARKKHSQVKQLTKINTKV